MAAPPGAVPTLGLDWKSPISSLSPHDAFIRSIDWGATELGPPESWPPQLHRLVDFVLADPVPAAVMWGDNLTMIYNEGFVDFAGDKHPKLMGKSPSTEYAEVWGTFVGIIDRGRMTGMATRHKDVQLFLERNGFPEECYVTYTFVPILDMEKNVVAFYHTAMETTKQIVSARRTKTLLHLGDAITTSRSLQEYWDNILKTFESNNQDTPYVLAYAFGDDSGAESFAPSGNDLSIASSTSTVRVPRTCVLAGAVGKAIGKVPLSFEVREEPDDVFVNVIIKAVRTGEMALLRDTDTGLPSWLFQPDDGTNSGQRYNSVLVVPIRPTSRNDSAGQNAIGFLILGLNPNRKFDSDYEQFAQICSRQMGTSAASILLLEQEIRRQKKLTEQLSISARDAQELERKFSRFAEISNIGMWISSAEGKLLYANKAWYEQADTPYLTPNFTVETWMPLVTDESLEEFKVHWGKLMVDKVPVNFECQFKARWNAPDPVTGEQLEGGRWFLITAFPEFGEDGTLKSAWGCNIDISYQKWAQNLKEARLNDVLEAKRQSENFIDMTSHEMRNPLSAILQCADGIKSTLEDALVDHQAGKPIVLDTPALESISESATTIMTCAQHQKRIVDDILTLSKLDASLLVVTPGEVDPIATIHHALQLHQQEFRNAKVESQVSIDPSYHELNIDKVFLDPSRLLQVLINLLTNSIKL